MKKIIVIVLSVVVLCIGVVWLIDLSTTSKYDVSNAKYHPIYNQLVYLTIDSHEGAKINYTLHNWSPTPIYYSDLTCDRPDLYSDDGGKLTVVIGTRRMSCLSIPSYLPLWPGFSASFTANVSRYTLTKDTTYRLSHPYHAWYSSNNMRYAFSDPLPALDSTPLTPFGRPLPDIFY